MLIPATVNVPEAVPLRTHDLRLVSDAPVGAALRNTTVGPAATIEMART